MTNKLKTKLTKITYTPKSVRRIKLATILTMLISSVIILVLSTGFRYTYYNETFVVQLPQQASVEQVASFASRNYVSGIDRDRRQVRFQGISRGELSTIVNDLSSQFTEGEQTTITVVTEILPLQLPFRLVYLLLAGIAVVTLFAYFTIYRKLANPNKRPFVGLFVRTLAAFLAGGLISVGFLSLTSYIYELTEITFGVVVTVVITLYFILLFTLINLDKTEKLPATLPIRQYYRRIATVTLFTNLFLILGLGAKFLIDGVLALIVLIIMSYALIEIPLLLVKKTADQLISNETTPAKTLPKQSKSTSSSTRKPKKKSKPRRR